MNNERRGHVCRPVVHRDAHSEEIAKEIVAWLRDVLFTPLLLALEEGKAVDRENFAPTGIGSALVVALRNDEVSYVASTGQFLGRFSNGVVRDLRALGATYHRATQSFFLPASQVPYELRGPIHDSALRSRGTHAAVLAVLASVVPNMGSTPNLAVVEPAAVGRVLSDLERQMQDTLGSVASLPEFADEDRRGLLGQVQQRLATPLREFVTERATVLRRVVEASLTAGASAVQLATVLEHEFSVAKRRARLLAEHETALLIAKFREARYKAAGVQNYAWETKQDERVRPGHAALHGRVFDWASPPIVDPASGRRCHPGEDFNCLPGDELINVLGGIKKAFRRWYSGKLTEVVLDSGESFRATPNHPVLTVNGWKPVGELNETDQLVQLREELFFPSKAESHDGVAAFSKVFDALRKSGFGETFAGEPKQFHGDGADGYVDVVRSARALRVDWKTGICESFRKLAFSVSLSFASFKRGLRQHFPTLGFAYCGSPRVARVGKRLAFSESHASHPKPVGFATGADGNARSDKPASDDVSVKTCAFRDGKLALTGHVRLDDRFWVNLQAAMPVRAAGIKVVRYSWFSGHVYNLETETGYYATANVVVSNCRCSPLPIVVVPTP